MGFKRFKKEKLGFKRSRIKYNLKRERMKNMFKTSKNKKWV